MAHGKCTAQIAGLAGKDITLSKAKNGDNYCRFSLSMHPRKSTSQATGEDEKKDDTVWMDCIAFGAVADALARTVKKGDYERQMRISSAVKTSPKKTASKPSTTICSSKSRLASMF